jgi:hypothetical protein
MPKNTYVKERKPMPRKQVSADGQTKRIKPLTQDTFWLAANETRSEIEREFFVAVRVVLHPSRSNWGWEMRCEAFRLRGKEKPWVWCQVSRMTPDASWGEFPAVLYQSLVALYTKCEETAQLERALPFSDA